MYFLNYCFSSVHLFKPCTSKSGNSEVYVVCIEFKGKKITPKMFQIFLEQYKVYKDKAMFPLDSIPDEFIIKVQTFSHMFMNEQINTINQNIWHFKRALKNEVHRLGYIKQEIAKRFISKYKVRPIDETNKLVPNSNNFKKYLSYSKDSDSVTVSDLLETANELEIVLGKRLTNVFYTEFCDIDLLPKSAYASDVSLPPSVYLDLIKNAPNDYMYYKYKSYIPYCYNNSEYKETIFKEIYSLIQNLQIGDNVVLIGYVFLTRFDVGLLHLFISCFTSVEYFDKGIIALTDCNENRNKVLEHFVTILDHLNNANGNNRKDLSLTVVSILSPNYLFNGIFDSELKRYNVNTIYILAAMCISFIHKKPLETVYKKGF